MRNFALLKQSDRYFTDGEHIYSVIKTLEQGFLVRLKENNGVVCIDKRSMDSKQYYRDISRVKVSEVVGQYKHGFLKAYMPPSIIEAAKNTPGYSLYENVDEGATSSIEKPKQSSLANWSIAKCKLIDPKKGMIAENTEVIAYIAVRHDQASAEQFAKEISETLDESEFLIVYAPDSIWKMAPRKIPIRASK